MPDDKYALPSQAQEAANAAYIWRVHCEGELAKAAAKSGVGFDEVNFRFQRYKLAWEKELELDQIAKGKPGYPPGTKFPD